MPINEKITPKISEQIYKLCSYCEFSNACPDKSEACCNFDKNNIKIISDLIYDLGSIGCPKPKQIWSFGIPINNKPANNTKSENPIEKLVNERLAICKKCPHYTENTDICNLHNPPIRCNSCWIKHMGSRCPDSPARWKQPGVE